MWVVRFSTLHTGYQKDRPRTHVTIVINLKTFLTWLFLLAACYVFGSYLVQNRHVWKYTLSDAEGYFFYLPSVFVHGNFEDYQIRNAAYFECLPGTGKLFTRYTCGTAMLEAPFFLAANVSRRVQGFDPNIYNSEDYGVAMLLGACFYGVLGLFFLFKILRRHFENPWAARLTVALLLLGTNLLHYVTSEPGMAHVYSFFLASLLIYLTPGIYEKPTYGRFLAMGVLLGWLVLIRPTNIVLALFPLLSGLQSGGGNRTPAFFQKSPAKNHLRRPGCVARLASAISVLAARDGRLDFLFLHHARLRQLGKTAHP